MTTVGRSILLASVALGITTGACWAGSTGFGFRGGGGTTGGPTVTVSQPVPTAPVITPISQPAPQQPRVPELPNLPPAVFRPPLTTPMDALNPIPYNAVGSEEIASALAGITETKQFTSAAELRQNRDFIDVRGDVNNWHREAPYLVQLKQGTVLASVRRPAMVGMLTTPVGQIAFHANSDAFVTYKDGTLRIANVDGLGQSVKVHIGPETSGQTFAIKPGYEMVVSGHKLSDVELHPSDGLARRPTATLGEGTVAVSQYHLQSALEGSAIVTSMTQKESDAKTQRILNDMARMSAVLNQVNGTNGFVK